MTCDESPSIEVCPPLILVVDDEPTIRELLLDFLVLEGYLVTAVASAEEALDCVDELRPSVVLLDLEMPGLNGLELLEVLSSKSWRPLCVMMTGYGTVETAISAMKSGAHDYLLKPFKVPEVVQVIERGLEKRRLEVENVRLKEIIDLYDASEKIGRRLHPDEVYDVLMEMMVNQAEADGLAIWARPDDGVEELYPLRTWIRDDAPEDTPGLLGRLALRCVQNRSAAQSARVETSESSPAVKIPYSLLSMPLRGEKGLRAMVVALRLQPQRPFRESKRKVLSILTDRAVSAMENASLYEELQNSFKQTIQALANILEDRDPYTRGHSDRVSQYARMIAEGLALPRDEVERIADSALMHDIGKLGIRFEELNKADPLSAAEYEMFKSHTTRGKWILEPITFLHPLIPGVYHHHERWDGKGYPLGLAGKEIPLMARILAVADTYDAMTSHRAYRRALPHEVAIQEIERCAATQFDPAVVEAFLRQMKGHHRGQTSRAERWRQLSE